MNAIKLAARVVEVSPLRYTPSGIPALNFVLEHESEVAEAGTTRQAKLSIRAVAFGAVAEAAGALELGKSRLFSGFLTNARANKSIVFHIQSIDQSAGQ